MNLNFAPITKETVGTKQFFKIYLNYMVLRKCLVRNLCIVTR